VQIVNPDASKSNVVDLVIVTPGNGEDVVTLTSSSPARPATTLPSSSPPRRTGYTDAIWISKWPRSVCSPLHEYLHSRWKSDSAGAAFLGHRRRGHLPFLGGRFRHQHELYGLGSGDVAVIAKQPAGLGIIHLTLQVPASATAGARTLFIQNANLDRTAAPGLGDPMSFGRPR